MNKSIITLAVACLAFTGLRGVALAHDDDDDEQQPEPVYQQNGQYGQRLAYPDPNRDPRYDQYSRQRGGDRVRDELNQLNGMLQHVEREMRTYRADRHMRGEFQHIRAEAYDLNNRFRRGEQYYDRRRVLGQIEHMHDELHHLEEEMHVPANLTFRWR